MKVHLYSIWYNEARMASWFLRHYSPWVERIIIYLEPSNDGTEEILRACPNVEIRPWHFTGLDDERFLAFFNSCWQEARGKADWVILADADELLYSPDMPALLARQDCDVMQATGYALISKTGWPEDDGHSQLYDLVKTGARQWNYDKMILHRPRINLIHTIGRHTYGTVWPRHNGRLITPPDLKLLHCHHVGGVEDTKARNQRCFDRAVRKQFAWNYTPEHDKATQVGTPAWVRDLIENQKLIQVA